MVFYYSHLKRTLWLFYYLCMGLFSILPSLYGSWSCSVAFLHICLIIDLRHCQQRWVYIEYISMCIWYILYVSFCFISCCRFDNNLHNECVLKKTSSVAFRESIGILANTHTHRQTVRQTRNRNETYFKLVLIFMHKQYYVYAPNHAPMPCAARPAQRLTWLIKTSRSSTTATTTTWATTTKIRATAWAA